MTAVTVSAPARLHAGFASLSLAHDRLYGGIGVAIEEPRVTVTAEPADAVAVECDGERAERYAERAVELLEVPGAAVTVESTIPAHVGLGSGTQLALSTLAAVAWCHGDEPAVRRRAPAMGRGGRSGVGVATFEQGGFVVDAGHPTWRFTADAPGRGDWTVPPVIARHDLPDDWRAVVAVPAGADPIHGDEEDDLIRSSLMEGDASGPTAVDRALVDRVLPGAAAGDLAAFAAGLETVDRVNGAWYADVQGGRYRPAARPIVERLRDTTGAVGVGQSSWGPAVFALARSEDAERLRDVAVSDGVDVHVTGFDGRGARRR